MKVNLIDMVHEFGFIKTRNAIQSLYDQDALDHEQAKAIMLQLQQVYSDRYTLLEYRGCIFISSEDAQYDARMIASMTLH